MAKNVFLQYSTLLLFYLHRAKLPTLNLPGHINQNKQVWYETKSPSAGRSWQQPLKDVRAHCYCASLVRTLFIRHARATSFSSACTEPKTQQNIELMTFVLTWCANIFVGCSVTPAFFFGRSLPFLILFIILKNEKNLYVRSFIFSSNTIQIGSNW